MDVNTNQTSNLCQRICGPVSNWEPCTNMLWFWMLLHCTVISSVQVIFSFRCIWWLRWAHSKLWPRNWLVTFLWLGPTRFLPPIKLYKNKHTLSFLNSSLLNTGTHNNSVSAGTPIKWPKDWLGHYAISTVLNVRHIYKAKSRLHIKKYILYKTCVFWTWSRIFYLE